MQLSRRRLLQGVGVSVGVGLLSTPATATETERVFVHPESGILGELFDAIEAVGGTTILEFENFDFLVASVPADRRTTLLEDPRIARIEDDDETGIPSDWDPTLPDLLDPGGGEDCSRHPSQEPSWGVERIGADSVDPSGSGVDVGILDTGIATDHCSLSVADGRNFTGDGTANDYEDRHGHGTHVAGISGATDNEYGVVGVAPETNLYAVKVLNDDGAGHHSALVAGIDWCLSNDIEIISMSLGGGGASDTVDEALETAQAAGHLLISAAGNEGNDGANSCEPGTMTYPATHPDVLAVTGMNEDETLGAYSSVGSTVDLLAPGTEVTSTTVDNEYAEASGTSVAAPFATGVAALLWETRDEDGPGPNEPVRSILGETAEPVLETCAEGNGLVDARGAVGDDRATAGDSWTDTTPPGGGIDAVLDGISALVEWLTDRVAGLLEWVRQLVGT